MKPSEVIADEIRMTHSPERYGADIDGQLMYCPDGEYIYYSEYQRLEKQRDELQKAALQLIWQIKTQDMAADKTDAANKLSRAIARLEYIAKAGDKT